MNIAGSGEGLEGVENLPEAAVITLHVNGREHRVRARQHHTLVETLRDELHLYSVREGCGVGMCGACTVLIDGQPQSGCLILSVAAEGRQIQTLESLADREGQLSDVQEAFLEYTAFQCSYCTPGFILTATSLLEENPSPNEEAIAEYLAGNRCGSYVKILAAVKDLARRRSRDDLASDSSR